MTPNDMLVQRDGRVWLRQTEAPMTRLGTVHHDGTNKWAAVCHGCPGLGDGPKELGLSRTRQDALWALADHWTDALLEQERGSSEHVE